MQMSEMHRSQFLYCLLDQYRVRLTIPVCRRPNILYVRITLYTKYLARCLKILLGISKGRRRQTLAKTHGKAHFPFSPNNVHTYRTFSQETPKGVKNFPVETLKFFSGGLSLYLINT